MANGYWTSHGQLTEAELAAVQLAVANGIATYAAGEIEKLAGIPNIAPLLALAEVTAYPRPFTLYQAGGLGVFTQPAATWTSVTASNNGSGKLRLSSAGIHGLATTGRKIYVGFATTGSGLHEIATIVNTTDLDFTTDYSAVSGAVTVYVANTESLCLDEVCTLPGGVVGQNGRVICSFVGESSAAASKYMYWRLGGSTVSEGVWSGADLLMTGEAIICNKGSEAAQVTTPFRYNAATTTYPTTKDTTGDLVVSLRLRVPNADNYISLDNISITVIPGL